MSRRCERPGCRAWLGPGQYSCAKCGRTEAISRDVKQLLQCSDPVWALRLLRALPVEDVPAEALDVALRLGADVVEAVLAKAPTLRATRVDLAVARGDLRSVQALCALQPPPFEVTPELLHCAGASLARRVCLGDAHTLESEIVRLLSHSLGPWHRVRGCAPGGVLSKDSWLTVWAYLDATTRVRTMARVCRFFRLCIEEEDKALHLHACGVRAMSMPDELLTPLLATPVFYGELQARNAASVAQHAQHGTHRFVWQARVALAGRYACSAHDEMWTLTVGEMPVLVWNPSVRLSGVVCSALLRVGTALELELRSELHRFRVAAASPTAHAALLNALRSAAVDVLGAPADVDAHEVVAFLATLLRAVPVKEKISNFSARLVPMPRVTSRSTIPMNSTESLLDLMLSTSADVVIHAAAK